MPLYLGSDIEARLFHFLLSLAFSNLTKKIL